MFQEKDNKVTDSATGSCLANLRMRELVNVTQVCVTWWCAFSETNTAYASYMEAMGSRQF